MIEVDDLARIGKIVAHQGNKGEVKVHPLTDFKERFKELRRVFLIRGARFLIPSPREDGGDERFSWEVEWVRYRKGWVILKFKDCESLSCSKELRGSFIAIPKKERIPLPEGHYYFDEIIGLNVYTEDHKFLGKVTSIFKTGSNDVYVVDEQLLIPAIHDVVRKINLREGRLEIRLMDGLL